MSTDPESRGGFGPFLEGVGPTFEDGGKVRFIRYGEISDLERAFELNGKNIAAFLVEPIQGEAGIVVPPQGYLAAVSALCKKHNVLLICDEIQTVSACFSSLQLSADSFPTTGSVPHRQDVVLRARQHQARYGSPRKGSIRRRYVDMNVPARIRPLIRFIVYPVSAVLADRDVMLCIKPGEHGSTYGGNPLGCAVAITALDVLVDEKLAERAEDLGQKFRTAVRDLKSPLVQTVRGRGLLNAVVMDEAKSVKGRTAWQFCLLLKSRGVLAKPTHINTYVLCYSMCG